MHLLHWRRKKPFAVHSSAVATTSGPFRALVNGDLLEAKERSAELKDVEPADFVRFLEYAYRRDYSAPLPQPDHDMLAAAASEAEHQNESLLMDEPPPPELAEYQQESVSEVVPDGDYWAGARKSGKKKLKVKR